MIAECEIIRELAKGGQKTVFLAKHPDIGDVVIKKGAIKSFTSLERIRREIELLSDLNSSFYPQQFHFNIDVKSKEFEIVEKCIEGKPLRDSMELFQTPNEIFKLIASLAEGLTIIWEKNIVHRDLKPENIIIRPNGTPCIIDLGIARFLDLESLTKTISPMGPCTPIYAAPEQLSNNKNQIDHRTDFFALGIITLELFLKVHPFDPTYLGNHYSIVENIMQNIYLTNTETVVSDASITEFASKTLKTQSFERFRSPKMLIDFVVKQI